MGEDLKKRVDFGQPFLYYVRTETNEDLKMSDFKIVFKENGEKCYRSGTPDSLLIDMFHYNLGRNSNFFQVLDSDAKVLVSSWANSWQFLLSRAHHYVIEVRHPDTKVVLIAGPVKRVVNALQGQYSDFAESNFELVAYPKWDKTVSATVLCDNTVDTFKVLTDWFDIEKPEVGEKQKAQTDWKGLYVNAELERIENLIQQHDTELAMNLIRKLVENVQK